MTHFAFIVPLKSSKLASNWNFTCALLERTLKSACNQLEPDFTVLVVCNEKPAINFPDPRVTYHIVDFLIPETYPEKERDKARKMWAALNHLRANKPEYVMFLDADDCVSKSLNSFTAKNPSSLGWYLNQGYEYIEGDSSIFLRTNNFQKKTNSSHIIKYDLLEKYIDFSFEHITSDFLFHKRLQEILASDGFLLEPLPFPGAVYITDNGENMYTDKKNYLFKWLGFKQMMRIYGGMLYKPFFRRRITRSIKEEFCLYSLY